MLVLRRGIWHTGAVSKDASAALIFIVFIWLLLARQDADAADESKKAPLRGLF